MATAQKNTCLPNAESASTPAAAATYAAADVPAPEALLAEYNALRERFQRTTNALASAAHDLKTPLSILNGYVEVLASEKLGPLTDRQREVLGDMRASGKRLQQFIQDFLTFSALETGGLQMKFSPGDINETLSEVCRLWSNRFQERKLALYFLANDKLPVLPFDAPKIERVISNLLENAFKFTPQGGTVWLHAEPYMWERRAAAQPSASERRRQNVTHPNSVKVSVSDTGPGISPEFHLEVFDDFFRLPGNEAQDGMGLGLAIARRLVTAMGGKIWVESEAEGGGCKFSFLVPYKPATAAASKGKAR